MYKINHILSTFSLFFFFCAVSKNVVQEKEEKDFVSSFIDNYGFTINARDTHEYHSFILGKTRDSFCDLESHLANNGLNVLGRMIICGYQEDAIPSYYTAMNRTVIDDEVSTKTKAGWQFASGNLFGFVTGFVLKDVNDIAYSHTVQQVFEHNQPERVGLFDDRAEIFHRHAFGQGYYILLSVRQAILKAIAQKKTSRVLQLLRELWKYLYAHGINDGSKTIIATQDILFSIHYAQYLLQSSLPIFKFFVGPDITYPIEVLRCQKEEATRSAQHFIQQFIPQLTQREHATTAYVFCSFVDGVGKSTLLGNIRNFAEHGTNFSQYERVDNSSSQRATVWQLRPGVIIADLPAQASHFIIKPDGLVYVSIDTVKSISQEQRGQLITYVKNNENLLKAQFVQLLHDTQKKIHLSDSVQVDTPVHSYAKNCITLNTKNPWIPFELNGFFYVFNPINKNDIRILQPLEGVHSYGLKVAEPEQMIFSKGLALPWSKELFLKDLSDQLACYGVKNIVFVDFVSMYPRTSRENIRVNCVMQYLKQVFGDLFDVQKSLYKGFMQPQELYLLLKRHRAEVVRSIVQETGLRWALFELLQRNTQKNITHLSSNEIVTLLKREFNDLYNTHKEHLLAVAHKKIVNEYDELLKAYACDKEFEAVVRFDFEPIVQFSRYLTNFFTQEIRNEYLNALWANMDAIYCRDTNACIDESKRKFVFADGSPAELLYTFDPACRDRLALKEFFTQLRAHWYAAIANIFKAQSESDRSYNLPQAVFCVPSLAVVYDSLGLIRVVRKSLPVITEHELTTKNELSVFFTQSEIKQKPILRWANFLGEEVCLDLKKMQTGAKLFAFSSKDGGAEKRNAISYLVDQFNYFNDSNNHHTLFMPTALLMKSINDQNYWHEITKEGVSKAKKNKRCSPDAARKGIRMLATLDMLCKDLDASIMVRKGNKFDFAAALELFEKITLPYYFGISFSAQLFDSYDTVEPVIAWESIEN